MTERGYSDIRDTQRDRDEKKTEKTTRKGGREENITHRGHLDRERSLIRKLPVGCYDLLETSTYRRTH